MGEAGHKSWIMVERGVGKGSGNFSKRLSEISDKKNLQTENSYGKERRKRRMERGERSLTSSEK